VPGLFRDPAELAPFAGAAPQVEHVPPVQLAGDDQSRAGYLVARALAAQAHRLAEPERSAALAALRAGQVAVRLEGEAGRYLEAVAGAAAVRLDKFALCAELGWPTKRAAALGRKAPRRRLFGGSEG
jgi:hypothetical protein